MTSEKMQMLRRDIKPGNGTSLISYQNYANLKKHLIEMRPIVDDRPNENYLKEKVAAPERYALSQNKKMDEIRKENNRLFGRLLNIYEVRQLIFYFSRSNTKFLSCRKKLQMSKTTRQVHLPLQRIR